MIRRLTVAYVLLVAVALLAFKVPLSVPVSQHMRNDTAAAVQRDATSMALLLASRDQASRDSLAATIRTYERETPGTVELLSTWRGGTRADWTDTALVVTVAASDHEAVRISYPTDQIDEEVWEIWMLRAALAVGILAVAAVLGAVAVRRLTRPLRDLHAMAGRLGDGDLTARAPVTGPPEIQTLARTLNLGAERLESLVAARQMFVADASHQLRTPLTALRLALDNIAEGVDDVGVRADIEQATSEVVRMSRLADGLLMLARADAGSGGTQRVDLSDAVEQRLAVWRPAAAERGIRFEVTGASEDLAPVVAGPGHVEQVLDNVLANALAVSPDGAPIRLDVQGSQDRIVLEVHDEGPGLSAEEKERAFDRFWRGRGLTGRSGSGLGLAIVNQLMTDAGGGVVLDDTPTGGLCVRISWLRAAATSGG
ncbi:MULTISPECIES: sensor histidine kinase [Nocardioides]|uniref:Signal transduction histidine-protein kinase/phosphatase MprB n=1 Tax=Nocardioides vastitatis TaxID=2568655 RepID=A0ABW0ZE85_9ACTN|nr:HAMP domain-containing sensor histidine kinase [Nocardioides sp.]THI97913.1 HAMP domain-containing histidine kinase [Nocardioides sp.]